LAKRSGALLAVVVLAVALAACGGDDGDESETSGGETVSKEEFIAQADEICRKGNAEIGAGADRVLSSGQGSQSERLEKFVDEILVPGSQEQIDAVAALPMPAGDEEEIQAFLDSAQADLDQLAESPETLQGDDPFAETNALGADYGFKVCSEG
jgi:hypothetical protein